MPVTFKVRGGKPGGGKGYLGSEDKALTISTVQELFLAEPVAFDLAQITSPHNRSNAAPGLPRGTLSANSDPHVTTGYAVRRLTPRETERLQGFPGDWTLLDADGRTIADSHRYRMMGNAVTVNTAEWIARRVLKVLA